MKKSYAFNSVEGDRKYNADDIAFDKAIFYSDGVVVQGGNVLGTQLQVEHVAGMQIKVDNGIGIIKGRTVSFEGIADGSELVTLPQADLVLDRIDRIVLELNLTDNVRDIVLKSIQGIPNASPVAPTLTRTDEIYQISLAQIRVIANSGTIGTITDERSNSNVCGLSNVVVGITPPTGNDAVTIKVSSEIKEIYKLADDKDFVDFVLRQSLNLSSYQSFCTTTTATSLDCAFGLNNADRVLGIGLQLAMYAWFKGDSRITYPFTHMVKKQTFQDILDDNNSFFELMNNANALALVNLSTGFAKVKKDAELSNESKMSKLAVASVGFDTTNYTTFTSVVNDASVMDAIKNSKNALNIIVMNPSFITAFEASTVAVTAMKTSSLKAQSSRTRVYNTTPGVAVNGKCWVLSFNQNWGGGTTYSAVVASKMSGGSVTIRTDYCYSSWYEINKFYNPVTFSLTPAGDLGVAGAVEYIPLF